MAKLVLHVIPLPAELLREAADAAGGFRLDGTLLAVRQGGLRDDVLAMAGAAGHPGWFDPPVAVFHELAERLGATDREPLSGDERAVLIERVMRDRGGTVFGQLERLPEFVDAVESLIGELVAEGVTADQFDQAAGAAVVAEDWDRERNLALAAIYRAYHEALGGDGSAPRCDGRDTYGDIAAAVRADPAGVVARLAGRRSLRIVGLADLRSGWRDLLAALRESPAFERIDLYALDEQLLAEGLVPDEIDRRPAGAVPPVTLVRAPDTDREVEEIAMRVRRLLEHGVTPDRIAVVSRKARPHVDLMLAALTRAGVPATARRRIGYREIPVVKSLVTLLQAAAEGWTRYGLSELARQPYFANRLDVRVVDFLGYRSAITGLDAWRDALDQLVASAEARERGEEPEDERRGWMPPADRARNARERFEAFQSIAVALDGERTLREWLAWLDGFLGDDPWRIERKIRRIPEERWDVARVDLAGWRALRSTAGGWRAALDTWGDDGEALDALAFLVRMATVLSGDVALWTTCRRGVAVLEGLAAAYRHFDHLFVVGLEAGTFPTRRPRSPILSEEDRAALKVAGLPIDLEPVWEARELSLFRALRTGGGQVTLSHAVLDASGREVIGSAFLEGLEAVAEETIETSRVLTPGLPLFAHPAVARQATEAAAMEGARETGLPNAWNGVVEAPDLRQFLADRFGEAYLWSPTQLESYAKCPWSWFSAKLLKLEKYEDPDQEIDAAVRGTIWHAALESFWGRVTAAFADQGRTGEARMLRAKDLVWARPWLSEALDEAWAAVGRDAWLGAPAMQAVTLEALRTTLLRYLDWEVTFIEQGFDPAEPKTGPRGVLRTAVDSHEFKIEGVWLERNGTRFVYRGSIDRVEVGVDTRVLSDGYVAAIDYKSGKYSTPGGGVPKAWEDRVVLQVPLYAHALTQVRPGAKVARVEYRAIRHCESVHTLELAEVKKPKTTPTLAEDPKAAAKLEAALVAATEHVARVREGAYPARYVESCKCPPFCAAWDICRVRGGPQRSGAR